MAAVHGHLDEMMRLVSEDPQVADSPDDYGRTALYYASVYGHVDLVRYLLQVGSDPNRSVEDGTTALHRACGEGNLSVVKLLVEEGKADPTTRSLCLWTPLMDASINGRVEVVNYLLSYHPQVATTIDELDNDGETALVKACKGVRQDKDMISIVKLLLSWGADPSLGNPTTPLSVALQRHNYPCVALLQDWERCYTVVKLRKLVDADAAAMMMMMIMTTTGNNPPSSSSLSSSSSSSSSSSPPLKRPHLFTSPDKHHHSKDVVVPLWLRHRSQAHQCWPKVEIVGDGGELSQVAEYVITTMKEETFMMLMELLLS